ncbi:pentapeptide repeat-containing protein [Oceanispirochaeta sp.]|jgi:fluoroquinolone resistance protein|uniref:pentapeptide repeat-containing protein n=1 Tax=Oceanispirochaeta sp. TaxID=2035350 RepID=UPI002631019C|nr:pentapeptide repeat-containing protein [Oceanispirochaeta sp.]MDA3955236.1 pentapeptide repeat-containing protein [Oceanispirochaeta sp.]
MQDLNDPDITDWEDEFFEKIILTASDLTGRNFQDCHFKTCRISSCILTGSSFRNCRFEDCELTLLKVANAGFSNCEFIRTMLQGINFSECNNPLFYPDFIDCEIRHCFFSNMDLKKKVFTGSRFRDSEFFRIDFREADYSRAEFTETPFSECDLRKTNFTGARGYTIHPEQNKLRGAIFTYPDVTALLAPLGIVIKD